MTTPIRVGITVTRRLAIVVSMVTRLAPSVAERACAGVAGATHRFRMCARQALTSER